MHAYVHTQYIQCTIYIRITHIHMYSRHTYVICTYIHCTPSQQALSVCAHFVGFSSVALGGDGGGEGALAPKRFVVLDFATHGHIMLVLARAVESAALEQ